jgi:cob(I)alamin adenosyltransferase
MKDRRAPIDKPRPFRHAARRMKPFPGITTGQGDKGFTRLFSGEEVPKDAPPLEALGDLDELVSVLGVARHHAVREETREAILKLQRELFKAGSELATSPDRTDSLPDRVDAPAVHRLEEQSRALETFRSMPEDFIIPAATLAAAHLDQARAVARRCERRVAALHRHGGCRNEHLLTWMNRLSDYLWLLARSEEDRSLPLRPSDGARPL